MIVDSPLKPLHLATTRPGVPCGWAAEANEMRESDTFSFRAEAKEEDRL